MAEKTIASFQTENHRIQLIVKNNKYLVIDNRKMINPSKLFFTDTDKLDFNEEYMIYVFFKHYCNKIYSLVLFNKMNCNYNLRNINYNHHYKEEIKNFYIFKK